MNPESKVFLAQQLWFGIALCVCVCLTFYIYLLSTGFVFRSLDTLSILNWGHVTENVPIMRKRDELLYHAWSRLRPCHNVCTFKMVCFTGWVTADGRVDKGKKNDPSGICI